MKPSFSRSLTWDMVPPVMKREKSSPCARAAFIASEARKTAQRAQRRIVRGPGMVVFNPLKARLIRRRHNVGEVDVLIPVQPTARDPPGMPIDEQDIGDTPMAIARVYGAAIGTRSNGIRIV